MLTQAVSVFENECHFGVVFNLIYYILTHIFCLLQSTVFVKKNIVVTSGFIGGFLIGLVS